MFGNIGMVVIGIVAIFALVFVFSDTVGHELYGLGGNGTFNIMTTPIENVVEIVHPSSISRLMHSAIDPIAPAFISTAHTNCNALGGTWFDTSTKMGCFDMPIGAFDTTNCIANPVYVQLGNTCNGLDAVWVCDTNNVGCMY